MGQLDAFAVGEALSVALVCFIVSWFTFVIAFLLLLTGAALNDQHGEDNLYFGNYGFTYCYVVKPGVFAGAAVLSLASVALGIFYYLTLNSGKDRNETWGAGGPAPPESRCHCNGTASISSTECRGTACVRARGHVHEAAVHVEIPTSVTAVEVAEDSCSEERGRCKNK